jgi:hypothetical protein
MIFKIILSHFILGYLSYYTLNYLWLFYPKVLLIILSYYNHKLFKAIIDYFILNYFWLFNLMLFYII